MSFPKGPNSPEVWQQLQWIAMPFSFMRGCRRRFGARRCIGMAFAQFEMKLAIGSIMSGFELALTAGRRVRLIRRGLTSGPSRSGW